MPVALKLDFAYFNAGGGHRSAATALQDVIASQGRPWDVRLLNIQEVLDPLDVFRKTTGIRLEDCYNRMLARGWTLGAAYWLPVMQAILRLHHRPSVDLLAQVWEERRPDMVVSLVPNLNRALFASLQRACPHVPLVTILTDMADYPPHFWMERQPQYFICGSAKAVEQAHAAGAEPWQIRRVSGMILRPRFYEPITVDRPAEREKLGLHPDKPTGLVLFGGEGSNVMYSVAERLGHSALDLQLILICGRNAKLQSRLASLNTRNRLLVEGFTKDIPYFMSLADFFIGKPGPGSISEALHMRLPVILESNAWTLPQERYNAEWVRDRGLGIVLENLRDIESAVRSLLAPGELSRLQIRTGQLQNTAVFEIPPLLEDIFHSHAAAITPAIPATHGADSAGSTPAATADTGHARNSAGRL